MDILKGLYNETNYKFVTLINIKQTDYEFPKVIQEHQQIVVGDMNCNLTDFLNLVNLNLIES